MQGIAGGLLCELNPDGELSKAVSEVEVSSDTWNVSDVEFVAGSEVVVLAIEPYVEPYELVRLIPC